MKKASIYVALVAGSVFGLAGAISGQDFQQSYKLSAGDSITIHNVSGDIKVVGYDGNAVTVTGTKKGRDAEQVSVKDMSSDGRLDLGVEYDCHSRCEASVNFEVRVPRSTNFRFDRLSTASGDVSVEDVQGNLTANSASGDVVIKNVTGTIKADSASGTVRVTNVVGQVSAKSASGSVEVSIARIEGTGSMNFSSASGDVRVLLPPNLDADVYLSSVSGDVRTDFPIEIEKDIRGAGSRGKAVFGSGSRTLKITSASGNVSLMRQ